jgi:hypothetical protein
VDLNDLWRYSNGEWTWMGGPQLTTSASSGNYGTRGVAAASNLPSGRDSAVTWADRSGNFWLFGGFGYDSLGNLPDLLAARAVPLAFTHVTVIDATGQPALHDCTVIVVGDRIQSIGDFSKTKLPKRTRVIDATRKYMIPGLWDMHVHFRGGANLIPDNEAWLSVFLAYGITGVREMGVDIPETVLRCYRDTGGGTLS